MHLTGSCTDIFTGLDHSAIIAFTHWLVVLPLSWPGAKQSMGCPTCQRTTTIPEGGVNNIPQNLHLGFEVEVAGYMSKIGSDGEKSCDVCIDGARDLQWCSVLHVISFSVPSVMSTTEAVDYCTIIRC